MLKADLIQKGLRNYMKEYDRKLFHMQALVASSTVKMLRKSNESHACHFITY